MLIVIPKSDSNICGLADHACVIAALACRKEFTVSLCPWPQPWLIANQERSVLLEFTPLAYSSVGLPWPLLLRVVGTRFAGGRVVTYFHELPFTNGQTLKRQVAVMLQRLFCMLLGALSSAVIVNQQAGVCWLGWLRWASRPIFFPSFSNVGGREHVLRPSDRPCKVVIFGSPGKRRHAHQLVADLGGYRKLFDVNVTVLDIGDPLKLPPPLQLEVQSLGALPAERVLALLLECRYGFFYAEPYQFSKSGVFASYCATGVVPIIAFPAPPGFEYFLSPHELAQASFRADRDNDIWLNCRHWYSRYSPEACVDQLCALFGDRTGSSSHPCQF